jgi:hypothetical protein
MIYLYIGGLWSSAVRIANRKFEMAQGLPQDCVPRRGTRARFFNDISRARARTLRKDVRASHYQAPHCRTEGRWCVEVHPQVASAARVPLRRRAPDGVPCNVTHVHTCEQLS